VHLERPTEGIPGPTDVVLGYRSPRRIQRLADRSAGRLRVVDADSAYFRLRHTEESAAALFATLEELLRPPAGEPASAP
jgi:hypothetical protein